MYISRIKHLIAMMEVLHISAECYPAAKTGGLADVVGALPKYLQAVGISSAAVIPRYRLPWIDQRRWEPVHIGAVRVDWRHVGYSVQRLESDELGYPLFVVDVPGLFDRPGIYADPLTKVPYADEVERYLVFQQAVLQWIGAFDATLQPRVLHLHDHHTGLIPFMMQYCPEYKALGHIPTVFTIHNAQYQGMFGWNSVFTLPFFDSWGRGVLDWGGVVNPMAAAIKCAWAVTTVSESYLFELHERSMGLEPLFRAEWAKEYGIINGIDAQVWDPATDPHVASRLEGRDADAFKSENKRMLCDAFGLDSSLPLVSFIGRLVGEKGADILPDAFKRILHSGTPVAFMVLGTGERAVEDAFRFMNHHYRSRFYALLEYNETVSRQVYAGSDFLVMPSRVEPCGLNQLYAMRYGTIPIVRSVGGLKDTVADLEDPQTPGRGIRFDQFSIEDLQHAIHRGVAMYHNHPDIVSAIRNRIMALDFSWESSIRRYIAVYRHIGAELGVATPPKDPSAATAPASTRRKTPGTKQKNRAS